MPSSVRPKPSKIGGVANEAAKQAAARAAAAAVQNGMIVGLGTGTTAVFFVEALAERVRRGHLTGVRGVSTSRASEGIASRHGLPLVTLTPLLRPDLSVDGADEVERESLALIKGGGGALVREKLVAVAARRFVVIADESKLVARLGAFPLPVAVFPFGWETTRARIEMALGVSPRLREKDGAPFVTDDGLYLLDLPIGRIDDPAETERRVKAIVGVAEVGLFVGVAHEVLLGQADGGVRHFAG
jgi:ribose 5-phosphate isomerase A